MDQPHIRRDLVSKLGPTMEEPEAWLQLLGGSEVIFMGSLTQFLRKTPPSRLGPFHGRGGPSGCVVMLSHAWQSLLATCGFTSSTLEINVASHTWAIHTWSWSVPQAGCFYSHAWHAWQPHGLAPEASSLLLARRGTQLTLSHAWYRTYEFDTT